MFFCVTVQEHFCAEKEYAAYKEKQYACLQTSSYCVWPSCGQAVTDIAVLKRPDPQVKSEASDQNQEFIGQFFGFFQIQLLFFCFCGGSGFKLHLFYLAVSGCCFSFEVGCCSAFFGCCYLCCFVLCKCIHRRAPCAFPVFPYHAACCGYAHGTDGGQAHTDAPVDAAPEAPGKFIAPFPQDSSAQDEHHAKVDKHPDQDAFFCFSQFFRFCIQFPTPPLNILDFLA